ncbi:MAG: N-6 DNA methylase [Treponema sp.]|nr:N-6 DNA methylase [Treponema sp.]
MNNAKFRKTLLAKLIITFEESGLPPADGVLALSTAMLKYNNIISSDWAARRRNRLEKMLAAWLAESNNNNILNNLFNDFELPGQDDDLIGLFYQSVQGISTKASLGAYYTPPELLRNITVPAGKTVCDPCCGSGGILLKILDKTHDPAKIFAGDIDEVALKICAVNLSLFFNSGDIEPNIIKKDIVFMDSGPYSGAEKYDYIVTNPPWGSKLTRNQKAEIVSRYPELETSETFSIVLNNCLDMVAEQGNLYFFLPYAFLNVAAHRKIRQKLLSLKGRMSLRLLGNPFRGVMSESVLLHFSVTDDITDTVFVTGKDGASYSIGKKTINAPHFIIGATAKNADTVILNKIFTVPFSLLKGRAAFALGIVTGNNRNVLLKEKTPGSEAVYRGRDIVPYRFSGPEYYIDFTPEKLQQAAPDALYRQKKVVYRFICRRLICAVDNKQSLLLNSANLFIPHNYPMETIVCLFNSPVYSFVFQKMFHSRKILRSHLEELPLPALSEAQHRKLFNIHQRLAGAAMDYREGQGEIDSFLTGLFDIDNNEYNAILDLFNAPAGSGPLAR